MSKKPIEIIKNYDFKPSQIYEKDGGLFATIQENIISQIVEARDEEYYNFLIKQIRDFIVKNNIETCFVINKEELIDCLQEHNELHCKINNLQSQLDHQKSMWNELKEWLEKKKSWNERQLKEAPINTEFYIRVSVQGITINKILEQMQELEGEDE